MGEQRYDAKRDSVHRLARHAERRDFKRRYDIRYALLYGPMRLALAERSKNCRPLSTKPRQDVVAAVRASIRHLGGHAGLGLLLVGYYLLQ